MKKLLLIILIIAPATLLAQQMNIVSFNIRYSTPNDGVNAWTNRIEMVTGLLQFHDADIFGLQEALYEQITDIQKDLSEYEWFGVGRDDGKKAGEFSPIFFKKSKFILINHGNFWLSENCEKPGLGWDAMCNRIVAWGKFQSKVTGKQFFVFNTHFDHKGEEARKNSAILIRDKIEEMTYKNNLPVIFPYGPVGTFTSFDWNAPMEKRIDYIFVQGRIKVLKYAVLTDSKNQRFPSDHLPVFIKVELK